MIYFTGRAEVENPKNVWPKHILISCTDPDTPIPTFATGAIATLRLRFDDLDGDHKDYDQARLIKELKLGRDPVYFDDAMADALVAFVLEHDPISQEIAILVHCEAGISRSAGVAAALADAHEQDYRRLPLHRNPRIPVRGIPNGLVRSLVTRAIYRSVTS